MQKVVVRKRDGVEKEFDPKLIYTAVFKAAKSTGVDDYSNHNLSEEIKDKVVNKIIKQGKDISVEDIQDLVEKQLMLSKWKDVAVAYVGYRHSRDKVREGKAAVFKDVEDFLNGNNEEVSTENSNKSDKETVTHRDLVAGIVSKHIASSTIAKDILELHEKGGLHCHDTDYYLSKGMHNCGVYNFEAMLKNGVKLGDVEIESPKSIGTAANVACQIFSKISGSSYGGQSMHEFDVVMKPYAERSLIKLKELQKRFNLPDEYVEEALRKEVYDACQTFIYQIQTVTSANGQSAFTSISLSLSTDPICKIIKEEYLKCHTNGIGPNHRSPIFPKVLYFVEKGINLDKTDPNYEEFQMALKCSSKHLYPDYIMAPNNREMTGGSENVITPMGCRSFVSKYVESGKEKTTGRFNLGVCTVVIPYAALNAQRKGTEFLEELGILCDKAFEFNQSRIERMKGTKASVAPILWQYGALATLKPEDTIDHLFYNGNATCSIGYAGLYEAQELLGDISKEFGMEVLQFMKDKTEEYTAKTQISYGLYGSPFENGCYRLTKALKNTFPRWSFDREYITNSYHLPVFADVDIIGKLEYEGGFYKITSSGNVNNIELPSMQNNLSGFEAVIKLAYDKVNYAIINQPVDKCFECGYRGDFKATEEGFVCPCCGNHDPETAECIRRVSGYTHSALARPANKGKYQEQQQRIKHM